MFSSINNKILHSLEHLHIKLYSKYITYLNKIKHMCSIFKYVPVYIKHKIGYNNYSYIKLNANLYDILYKFYNLNLSSGSSGKFATKIYSCYFKNLFKSVLNSINLEKNNLIYYTDNKQIALYLYKLFNNKVKLHDHTTEDYNVLTNIIVHLKISRPDIDKKYINLYIYNTETLLKILLEDFIKNINKQSIKNIAYLKLCSIYKINYLMYELFILHTFIRQNYKSTSKYTFNKFSAFNKNSFINLVENIIYSINVVEKPLLYNFNNLIHNFIFGQNLILKKFTTHLLNFNNKSYIKPIGSFLLCGPSGSGKTEIVKLITNYLYGSQTHLMQFDMSEYKEQHSLSRLIGSPPGYVGHEEGGNLINKLNSIPDSVILFDEIEKANKDIFSIFLQILDEGVLTDSKGVSCNFNKSLIFFTSNLGSNVFSSLSKKEEFNIKYYSKVRSEIHKNFKLEFINRLNDIVIFNPLLALYLYQLLDKHIKENYNNKINLSVILKSLMSVISYSPAQGSRFFVNNLNKILNNLNTLKNNKIYSYNKFIKYVILK
uniref:ClpC2 n=2 Tax=Babesia TaxID=5864 RepID=A0A411ADC0_9APIC|nr:ClpC2 [Babesia sp. Lintan]QAX27048.1 ClpC2 [Babesia motasi]QAX27079.1 ClpC2 [Babesia motasi]